MLRNEKAWIVSRAGIKLKQRGEAEATSYFQGTYLRFRINFTRIKGQTGSPQDTMWHAGKTEEFCWAWWYTAIIPSLKRLKQQNNKFLPNRASQQNSARWGVAGVWMTSRSNYFWMTVNLMLVQEMEISHKLKKHGSGCLTAKGLLSKAKNNYSFLACSYLYNSAVQSKWKSPRGGICTREQFNDSKLNILFSKRIHGLTPRFPISPLCESSCFSLLSFSHFIFLFPLLSY